MGDSVARALAVRLRELGVERVYGVAGEDHLRLLHELDAQGLAYVSAREESAACLMAAAEAQRTGLPGVAVVTIAPGLTNAINGIASAFLDHAPLLVISGQHSPERFPVIVRQAVDSHALVATVTKWTATAGTRIHQVLAKAIDTAMAPPAGPVFLEVRDDIARATASDDPADWPQLLAGKRPRLAPSYAGSELREVVAALQGADRPVLIVGGRGGDASVGEAVSMLCEQLRAPVLTSPAAKGLVHAGSPWLAGTFLNGNLESRLLARSDLVVAVGVDANDFFNVAWRYQAEVWSLEADTTNTQHFLPTRRQVVGDLAAILDSVRAVSPLSASSWELREVSAYRAKVERLFAVDGEGLTIPTAVYDTRQATPPETLITVDAGFGKPIVSYLWPASAPNSCFSSHGLSTMGYAIPAATALKAVHPDRPVVGFMGDGSLLMRASEIGVAAALGLSPVFIVWVDGSLSQIEVKQRRADLRPVGSRLPHVSCAAVAAAFGARGWDVGTRLELRDALREALAVRDAPCLIGARVDQASRASWFELLRG
jgi:acetolactate synthase-1/2/3 large subunit